MSNSAIFVPLQIWNITRNCKFISFNSDIITHNCEFISHNYVKKSQNYEIKNIFFVHFLHYINYLIMISSYQSKPHLLNYFSSTIFNSPSCNWMTPIRSIITQLFKERLTKLNPNALDCRWKVGTLTANGRCETCAVSGKGEQGE